jgi:hypothetical protein
MVVNDAFFLRDIKLGLGQILIHARAVILVNIS